MIEGMSLTLRVCRDVERDDRNVYDSDIGRPVYLHPVCLQMTAGDWCQKLTLSLLSTTPPSARGSIEQDPTVSRR